MRALRHLRAPGVLCACAAALFAQGAPQLSPTVRMNLAPVSSLLLKVSLPTPAVMVLPNGLTVLVFEDHRLPLVTLEIQVRGAGGLYDPPGRAGLATLAAAMMNEGAGARDGDQYADALERLGATVAASADFGPDATVAASGLAQNFDQWLPLTRDLLLYPAFNPAPLDRLKQRTRLELRQQRANPAFLANERFMQALYGSFPAATVSVANATLDAVTRDDLARWHATRYLPGNTVLAISGDVRAPTLLSMLRAAFAAWPVGQPIPEATPRLAMPGAPPPPPAKSIDLVDRPGSVQSTLLMGSLALTRTSPDWIPMAVLNAVLGGGPQSRLFMNLREKRGLTYGIASRFSGDTYAGPWLISGSFRTPVTADALTQILAEIARIRDQPVPNDELNDAKRALAGSFALSLQIPVVPLNDALAVRSFHLPADYWDTYTTRVMAVTPAEVQRVAQRYLDPATLQIVVVGDGAKIAAMLAPFGPLQRWNADGTRSAEAAAGHR